MEMDELKRIEMLENINRHVEAGEYETAFDMLSSFATDIYERLERIERYLSTGDYDAVFA